MAVQRGAWINERVQLTGRLGRGAFGEVWLAHHTGLGAEVAVKLISSSPRSEIDDAFLRFRREAEVAARIHSPYVVRTFDHGLMHDGTPYIIMERLIGRTLGEELRAAGPLGLDQVLEIARQVGSVLDEAHAAGVVHRDIKPQNIFLLAGVEETFVKVLDWGSAKRRTALAAEVTDPSLVLGSPAYFSRDVLLDPRRVDGRTDLWALTVTLYKCLTGALPYRGAELGDMCAAILDGEVVPPRRHRPELPQAIDAWFIAALHHDPGRRPPSGAELVSSLGRAAQSRARRHARRRRQATWALAACVPLLATFLVFAVVALARTTDRTRADGLSAGLAQRAAQTRSTREAPPVPP